MTPKPSEFASNVSVAGEPSGRQNRGSGWEMPRGGVPGRPKKPSLTDKQRRFIDEYQKDWNLVDAVLRAGYEAARRSSASLIGQNLLKQPLVKAAIEEKRRKLAAKADITAERTLEEIRRVEFFDFRKLFNPDGSLKNPEDMDGETASVVSSVEVFEEY